MLLRQEFLCTFEIYFTKYLATMFGTLRYVIKDELDLFDEKISKIIQISCKKRPDPDPDSDPVQLFRIRPGQNFRTRLIPCSIKRSWHGLSRRLVKAVFRIRWFQCGSGFLKLQESPTALKREHPALQKFKFLPFFIFEGHFYPDKSGSSRPKSMRIRMRNTV
jgi:hypothetical protein